MPATCSNRLVDCTYAYLYLNTAFTLHPDKLPGASCLMSVVSLCADSMQAMHVELSHIYT